MTALSYAPGHAPDGPWATYLDEIERVRPYLGPLERWVETLKRPKRCLVVDIPIEMDDGSVSHFEGFRVQHTLSRGPGKCGSPARSASSSARCRTFPRRTSTPTPR
jgi:glutamate dehydrogenase (NAD(P)+)